MKISNFTLFLGTILHVYDGSKIEIRNISTVVDGGVCFLTNFCVLPKSGYLQIKRKTPMINFQTINNVISSLFTVFP